MADEESLEIGISHNDDIKESVDNLTKAVETLLNLFKTASADIHTEGDADLGKKLDILIKQNQDIARGILALLELHKEHLPRISQNSGSGERRYRSRRAPMPTVLPLQRIEPNISISNPQQQRPMAPMPQMQQPLPQMQPLQQDMGMQQANERLTFELPDFPEEEKPKEKKGLFGLGR